MWTAGISGGLEEEPARCEGAAEAAPLRDLSEPGPTSPASALGRASPAHPQEPALSTPERRGPPLCRREGSGSRRHPGRPRG